MPRKLAGVVATLLLLAVPYAGGRAQEEQAPAPLAAPGKQAARASLSKEELQMKLRLEEALLRLHEASRAAHKNESEYRESLELQAKGIYTNQEVNLAEERYNQAIKDREQAKIDLEKTKLEFFQNASHIEVTSAVKYPRPDGTKGVRLVLHNSSNLERIRLADQLAGGGDRGPDEWEALLRIENITVALLVDGTVVARPYEAHVDDLAYQETRTLNFLLYQDADRVTVSLKFLGREEATKLFLETEAADDRVAVDSVRFSQEGHLEDVVRYDITLERLLEEEKSFSLRVMGLPRDFQYKYLDTNSAAVTRVRFGRGTTRESLTLEVAVPSQLGADMLDREQRFFAVAGDEAALARVGEPPAEDLEQALREAGLGFEILTLIPRGVGELTLSAPNAFGTLHGREPSVLTAEIKNTGTLPLFGIEVELRGPREWELSAEPGREIRLEPGQSQRIAIRSEPEAEPAVGDYEIRARARCRASGKLVESEERSFRVRVEGQGSMLPTAVVGGVLFVLIASALVLTLRLSRR